jgi:hypothetical protein
MPARNWLEEGKSILTRKLWLDGSAAGTISATVPANYRMMRASIVTCTFIPL